jgi:hypothetical protein
VEKQIRERENLIGKSRFHQVNRKIIAEVIKRINNGQGKILEIVGITHPPKFLQRYAFN